MIAALWRRPAVGGAMTLALLAASLGAASVASLAPERSASGETACDLTADDSADLFDELATLGEADDGDDFAPF